MKKLLREARGYCVLFTALFLVMFASVACSREITQKNDHELMHRGHRYLVLGDGVDSRATTVVHDPDCPKCLNRGK